MKIAVIGAGAMGASRVFVDLTIMVVIGTILAQMPTILESQVGVIDGVVTPWGELERYTLSIPLGVSCVLIFVNAAVDHLRNSVWRYTTPFAKRPLSMRKPR